jgi:hypothetical protein
MMRALVLGLLGAIGAIGGHVFLADFVPARSTASEKAESKKYTVHKIGSLNVPVFRRGELQGYVVVQISYSMEGALREITTGGVEALLQDETFRLLYSDPNIDIKSLQTYDIQGLTKRLLERIKSRAPNESFKDVLVNGFSFVPASAFKR